MGKEFNVSDADMAAIVAVISDAMHSELDGPIAQLHEKAEESARQLKKMKKLTKKVREAVYNPGLTYDKKDVMYEETDNNPSTNSLINTSDSDSDSDSDNSANFIPRTQHYKDVQKTTNGRISPYTGQEQGDPYGWFKSMYELNKAKNREEGKGDFS